MEFLNSLQQPLGNNPWPTYLKNQNYRTWFHKQCDYLIRFQAKRRINKSILLQKWSKSIFNIEDDVYETLIFAYNKL